MQLEIQRKFNSKALKNDSSHFEKSTKKLFCVMI
jgi:hypothetical protein